MNRVRCFLLLLAIQGAALAQAQAPLPAVPPGSAPAEASPSALQAERNRIASERAAAESRFGVEEKACYKKFAVNDCLNDVRVRRRETLADLRRQDLSLNDAERKRRGAEALQRIEDKSSPQKLQEAEDRRAKALANQQARDDKAADKQKAAEESREKARSRVQAQLGREQESADKAASRSAKAASASSKAAEYEARQRDAAERRARAEKKAAERTKPPAKPLPPVPGAS